MREIFEVAFGQGAEREAAGGSRVIAAVRRGRDSEW
jgi:hypothetical protein